MTTIILTQTTETNTFSVDLTNLNCSVELVLNNPFFVISLPKDPMQDPYGPKTDSNQVIVNLNMLTERYRLTFDLKDGIEPGSNYYKLYTMFTNGYEISFSLADSLVFMEQLSMEVKPGRKNFIDGCSLTLVTGSPFSFGIRS